MAQSGELLKLIWLIVRPSAPGQCLGSPPVSSARGEGFCKEPNIPTSHLQLDF